MQSYTTELMWMKEVEREEKDEYKTVNLLTYLTSKTTSLK